MKLYSLSGHPNKPCNVITFKKCTLMLDCGLDVSSLLYFLPLPLVPSCKLNNLSFWMPRETDPQLEGELRECINKVFIDSTPEFKTPCSHLIDFSEVDAILVSNYLSMLALPYITNNTGFKGVVLMTEPTMQIGRLFMEELVTYLDRSPKSKRASHWKNCLRLMPPPLNEAKFAKSWSLAYNMKAISEALSHVQIVAYNERIDVCGALGVTAVSSGFCLGSCNWLIATDHERIAYLSGSSTLTTHPRPVDQSALKNVDVLIMTALNHTPMFNPDSMLGEFCVAVAQTVRSGGCALVPCYPSGVVYDLFECLSTHLDNVNLPFIPMYFISPVAESSLAYSNIFSEWLSSSKQSRVFQMEDPFPHAHLVKNGRLKAFKNIHNDEFNAEFRQPSIVFCGHPSLRFGDAVHFIELWGNNPQNAVLFTEPDFDFMSALAPFQPLQIRPVHCPIDTSLNFSQAKKLIAELKPTKIVVPEQYTRPQSIDFYLRPPGSLQPGRGELCLDLDDPPLTFTENSVLHIGLKRQWETVELSSQLASSLDLVNVRPGVHAATFSAQLNELNNKYKIEPLEGGDRVETSPCCSYGSISVDDLLQRLARSGYTDVTVDEDNNTVNIIVEKEGVTIQLKENSTEVILRNPNMRNKMKKIVLNCLNNF